MILSGFNPITKLAEEGSQSKFYRTRTAPSSSSTLPTMISLTVRLADVPKISIENSTPYLTLGTIITTHTEMNSGNVISFIIGLIIGMIILIIIVWILYATRAPPFSFCSDGTRCTGTDYYNDPGDALAANPSLTASEILVITTDEVMLYDRVRKTADCIPEGDQIVEITYPQYCSMTQANGATFLYRDIAFNANVYRPAPGTTGPVPNLATQGSCMPMIEPGSPFVRGVPVLRWDKNPLMA